MATMNRLRTSMLLLVGAGAFYAAADWSGQGGQGARVTNDGVVAAMSKPPGPARWMTPGAGPASTAEAPASAASRRVPSSGGDAFAPLSWLPPAPPPPPAPVVAPAPPPAPVAPPLPFVFVGMVEKGADRPQAYLAKGDALLVVAVGDTIDNNTYRVDALTPSGVLLTYLPLGQQQTVNVPRGSP